MSKSKVVPIRQELYRMVPLNRLICARCNDGFHFEHCFGFDCECLCRDPQPPRRLKPKRDKNGLTEEERRDQNDFPFDDYEPLNV